MLFLCMQKCQLKTGTIDRTIFRLFDPIILPSIIRLSISGMKIGRTLVMTMYEGGIELVTAREMRRYKLPIL